MKSLTEDSSSSYTGELDHYMEGTLGDIAPLLPQSRHPPSPERSQIVADAWQKDLDRVRALSALRT